MRRFSLARASAVIAAALALSQLTGLARTTILNSRFGAGDALDAFYAAFRVTDLLFNLLAGGALASAFIPTFAGYLATGRRAHAWALARATSLIVFAALAAFAMVCAVLAEPLIRTVVAPGFADGKVALTVSLLRVMLISTVIFGVSGLVMGVLQSHQHFAAPALAPTFYNLGIVLGVLALSPSRGVMGAAVGVALGAALHMAVQLPTLLRLWRARAADMAEPGDAPGLAQDVQRILRLMLPRMAGLGAVQVNFIVNTRLASAMREGAVSALNIAFTLMLIPQAAIAQAVATALFPALSAHAARGERDEYRHILTRALRYVLALSVPAAVGLAALGRPIVRFLFERGEFGPDSTAAVAFALLFYAAGLVAHAAYELLTRGFYALKDTATPVAVGVGGVMINIVLSYALAAAFQRAGWLPFGGVALANTIATWLEALTLLALLAKRIGLGGSHLAGLARTTITAVLASAVMGAVLMVWRSIAGDGPMGALSGVALGALAYLGSGLAIGNRELRDGLQLARARLPRRMPRA